MTEAREEFTLPSLMPHSLSAPLLNGDRAALARAITLAESARPDHRAQAEALLAELLPSTGHSIRLGITGVPGVGKSTFIETFGLHAIEQGKKVAVLAIDPSSARTGGSIMGDKTRMPRLSMHERAFIRPSPTAGSLGGVARRTREAMLLAEAAGYDFIIVETVGVGQSETEVAEMVDMFILLLLPGSGDELQGIKKGIVELADLAVVTKADGELAAQAKRVRADYSAALRILTASSAAWQPKVLTASALEGKGIAEIYRAVEDYLAAHAAENGISRRRAAQAVSWMWKEIRESLQERFLAHEGVRASLAAMEEAVSSGRVTPAEGAKALLGKFLG